MKNLETLRKDVAHFLKKLKHDNSEEFSNKHSKKDLNILQKHLDLFKIIQKEIVPIEGTDFFKVSYALKDKNKEKEHPSHWFAVKHENNKVILISRFHYLEAKAIKENWRKTSHNKITFYFDYTIKKSLDETMISSSIDQIKTATTLFQIPNDITLNYFVCDNYESMKTLGFNSTTSNANNIISFSAFDVFEIIKMITSNLNPNASSFIADGFALYYSKYIARGNDTFEFSSSDIDPMAKEILFHAPYDKIKKCIQNNKYEEITNTLFFFSVIYTSKNQTIDFNLILLSPPTSFITFLVRENTLIDISEKQAISNVIRLLSLTSYKDIKKEFKKLFTFSIGKYNRQWKKHLKTI